MRRFRQQEGGFNMARRYKELLEAAMQHLKHVHKYEDTPEVRKTLQKAMKDGTPLK